MLMTLLAATSYGGLIFLIGVLAMIGLVVASALGRVPWVATAIAVVAIFVILVVFGAGPPDLD